jgi:hypothetical protein
MKRPAGALVFINRDLAIVGKTSLALPAQNRGRGVTIGLPAHRQAACPVSDGGCVFRAHATQ